MFAYLLSVIPKVKAYSPALLMNADSLLSGAEEAEAYMEAIAVAAASTVIFITISVLNMNKRQV